MKGVKELYCTNCGKYNHSYKICTEPVTSYGVILLKLEVGQKIVQTTLQKLSVVDISKNCETGINITEYNDIEKFSILKNSVKYLLVQRKYTLGFMEFIRGRYNVDNVEGIIFLFKQMTAEEINRIKTFTFDNLWNNVWGETKTKSIYTNEYNNAKDKFNKLKTMVSNELNLDFYVNNVVPNWKYAEWGFPKGRRNPKEDDLTCATREFMEESNYKEGDFCIINKNNPIIESLVGTNGVNYRHVYYLGISLTDKEPFINNDNYSQSSEIGDIQFFTYEEAMGIIRKHHIERQRIITDTYICVMNKLLENFYMV